jgi:hypothetical protein
MNALRIDRRQGKWFQFDVNSTILVDKGMTALPAKLLRMAHGFLSVIFIELPNLSSFSEASQPDIDLHGLRIETRENEPYSVFLNQRNAVGAERIGRHRTNDFSSFELG